MRNLATMEIFPAKLRSCLMPMRLTSKYSPTSRVSSACVESSRDTVTLRKHGGETLTAMPRPIQRMLCAR